MNAIGEKLKQIQRDHELNNIEISAILGVDRTAYTRYTRKEKPITPPVEALIRLAKHFNISLDWLCGLDSITKEKSEIHNMKEYLTSILNQYLYTQKNQAISFKISEKKERFSVSLSSGEPYLSFNDDTYTIVNVIDELNLNDSKNTVQHEEMPKEIGDRIYSLNDSTVNRFLKDFQQFSDLYSRESITKEQLIEFMEGRINKLSDEYKSELRHILRDTKLKDFVQ